MDTIGSDRLIPETTKSQYNKRTINELSFNLFFFRNILTFLDTYGVFL